MDATSHIEIMCCGPADESNRTILIRLGDSSIAIDHDSLDVNLLSAGRFSILFVHLNGWAFVTYEVTSGDMQKFLAAVFPDFADPAGPSVALGPEALELLDVKFGSHDAG
ncbi:hypothetical protein [Paraburkholderia graminis]|uniref:hypothetical protein n=1 Tax=Paraburkholderia graminis TaxID=60548 RepID=UPI0004A7F926